MTPEMSAALRLAEAPLQVAFHKNSAVNETVLRIANLIVPIYNEVLTWHLDDTETNFIANFATATGVVAAQFPLAVGDSLRHQLNVMEVVIRLFEAGAMRTIKDFHEKRAGEPSENDLCVLAVNVSPENNPTHARFAVQAGQNKQHVAHCPFCHLEGDTFPVDDTETIQVFFFRDEPSAKEYMTSGLCQRCQDDFFKHGVQ